jgi:hypothetical protein
MQQAISVFMQLLRKGFFMVALVSMLSLPMWFGISNQPSYAAVSANESLSQKAQSPEIREQAYEEAKEIADDPKKGVEKNYERNVEEYFEEHPDQAGVIEEAKELVNKVTGNE